MFGNINVIMQRTKSTRAGNEGRRLRLRKKSPFEVSVTVISILLALVVILVNICLSCYLSFLNTLIHDFLIRN